MKMIKLILTTALLMGFTINAAAKDDHMNTAIGGYDAVSYFTVNKAVRGSGFHTATHNSQVYLFSSKENKSLFEKNPSKYAPQYNGWCAYGVSVGKKFHTDPNVFAIVNNKLYLNLDSGIQKKWNAAQKKLIKDADKKWPGIKAKGISTL